MTYYRLPFSYTNCVKTNKLSNLLYYNILIHFASSLLNTEGYVESRNYITSYNNLRTNSGAMTIWTCPTTVSKVTT